ncbi:MAG TPA: nitroreductase/quinone reductase family protein [Candidatus Dormibacteraeota bacterium]|nr:nitroreductase/quinone reductase family protein [Candidatus Dormibacteraeota bacterium]
MEVRVLSSALSGRVSLTGKRPVLLLTTTGRRSGRPRTVPLFYLRVAREARGEELEDCWPLFIEMWSAYERFYADTHERAIFVLE